MSIDAKRYSGELRKLCEDLYFHDITQPEYVIRRNEIFDRIERELLTGIHSEPTVEETSDFDEVLAEDLHYDQE